MNKKLVYLVLILLLAFSISACSGEKVEQANSSKEDVINNIESSNKEENAQDVIINSLLESNYLGNGMEIFNINDIKDFSEVNAAWINDQSVIFAAYNEPKLDDPELYSDKKAVEDLEANTDWSKYPISFYLTDSLTNKSKKIFEYPLSGRMPFLYLNVLDDGNIAFKTSRELVIISGDNYSILKKIDIPSYAGIVNTAISPSGKYVAMIDNEKHLCNIVSVLDLTLIYCFRLEDSFTYRAPQWAEDSRSLFCYSTHSESSDSVIILNLDTKDISMFDYSQKMLSKASRIFWHDNSGFLQRYDELEGTKSVTSILELYNLKERTSAQSEFILNNSLNSVSVNENGCYIGNKYDDYFSTVIIDTVNNKCFTTEKTKMGGSMIPAIWSKNGQKAISFYTAITNTKGEYSRWTAILYDLEKLF